MRKHITLAMTSAIVGSLLVPMQSSGTGMEQLPTEVQQMILNKLETKNLFNYGQASTDANQAAKDALQTHQANIDPKQLTSGNIETFKQIRDLRLKAEKATDESMALIGKLTNLRSLDLRGAQLTDAGFAQLKNLTNLEVLLLADTNITDSGVANIAGLQHLEVLALGTDVTDASLAHLKNLTNLRVLFLDKTKVSDAGLVNLADLQNLGVIFLGQTRVQGSGLKNLVGLPNLKYVNLYRIRILPDTKQFIEEFKKQKPNILDFRHPSAGGYVSSNF